MIVVKLEEQDSVKSFDCGDDDLNDFILHESPLYRKEKLAVTYVLKEADDLANEHIKAFFSLSNDRISISDFDSKNPSTSAMASCHSTKRMPTNPRGCSTSTSTTWTKIDRHAAPSLPLKQD